jgi:hypothetical protein
MRMDKARSAWGQAGRMIVAFRRHAARGRGSVHRPSALGSDLLDSVGRAINDYTDANVNRHRVNPLRATAMSDKGRRGSHRESLEISRRPPICVCR